MGKQNRQRRAEKRRRRQRAQPPAGRRPPADRQRDVPPPEGGRRDPTLDAPEGGELPPIVIERLARAAAVAHAQRSRHLDDLVGQLDGAGGRGLVDRVLGDLLESAVGTAWQHGWQPAELLHTVRRRGTSLTEQLALDVVAGELRRYASSTVDPAWRDQVDGLGAVVWWDPGRPHLAQWADRQGTTRPEAVRAAVALLSTLDRLPPLPRLCAPPGEALARRPRSEAGGIPADTLQRVRALLAKAESTTFPEEAEAFTTKAHQLMARHAIDAAVLAAAAGTDVRAGVVGRRIPIDDPYFGPKAMLLAAVASAHRCRTVSQDVLGLCAVFGHDVDLAAVEVLFTSLLVQATAAMTAAGAQVDHRGRSRTRSFRHSFLVAYGSRIGQRLRAATEAAVSDAEGAGTSLLPVLAARDEAVEAVMEEAYPHLQRRTVRATNRAGWAAGVVAADQADIGSKPALSPTEAAS